MHPEHHEPPHYDIEHLIEAGRIALHEREYEHAARLLREAARRAPMRHDVRELLAMAVDGTLAVRRHERDEQPQPSAPLAALRAREAYESTLPRPDVSRVEPPRPGASPGSRSEMLHPPRREAVIETFIPAGVTPLTEVIELQPPRSSRRSQSTFGPRPVPGRAAEIPEPQNFSRRHRRGPLSALLLTLVMGLLICGTAGGLAWAYFEYGDRFGLRPTPEQVKLQNTLQQVAEYRAKGNITMAIELLEKLPISPERNASLADIYLDQGEKSFNASPSQLENALESFRRAVDQDSNNRKAASMLGRTYLMLAREKAADPKSAAQYLKLAREQFESCIATDPKDLDAMEYLAKVAILQRDDFLLVKTYRQIIETAPDSPKAKDARNAAATRGLKI